MSKSKAEPKTGPAVESRSILVTFTVPGLKKIITALRATKMAHGELLMEDSKAMHNIVVAMALGLNSVIIA